MADEIPSDIETSLVIIYDVVGRILHDYDRLPNIHSLAPFVSLLRQWHEFVTQRMEAMPQDVDHLP